MRHLAFPFALVCLVSSAVGQVVFDDDSTDGTWENATNWVGDTLPGATDNVQIHSGLTASLSSNQTITDFTVGSDGAGGTSGVVNHASGTLTGAGTSWAKVGTDGAGNIGRYNLSSTGALTNFDVFALGIVGGNGTLDLSGNASLTTNSGVAMGGTAVVNQTGGSFTSGAWIGLSNFGGGTVNYNISAGRVISNGDFFSVGEDGVGNLNVSGVANVQANGVAMIVGRNDNSTGLVEITGSSASVVVTDLRLDTGTGSSGTLSYIADSGGITPIVSGDNTEFGDNALLFLDLTGQSNFGSIGSGVVPQDIVLIENSTAVSGTFLGLPEGASVPIGGGKTGTLSYVGGDGDDVVLTLLIPEPAAMSLIGLCGVAAILRRRRR